MMLWYILGFLVLINVIGVVAVACLDDRGSWEFPRGLRRGATPKKGDDSEP